MEMQIQLEDLLDDMQMPPYLLGYQYWIDMVKLALNYDITTYKFPMCDLYIHVAKLNNTKYTRVERCLRVARKKCRKSCKNNIEFLVELIKQYNRRKYYYE